MMSSDLPQGSQIRSP